VTAEPEALPVMEIIIKPTEACNGTCVYCSADGTLGKRKTLPQEQLGRLFDIFAPWLRGGDRRNLRFLWHGGEPMLCGPEYYAEIMQQQQRAFGDDRGRVRNAMQSNLSLVDERWVPLLRDLLKDQAIGTSFDIVDGVRGLAGGKDLREIWVRAVTRLRQAGIRVGAVYVAHRKSRDRASEIYRFFRNIGLHVRVNPLYKEGRADRRESKALWIIAEEYGQFLVDLCDLWHADRMRWSIMPLMEWYRAWKGHSRLCCDSRGMCHTSHLGINPDGAVFGCGRQSDHGANRLGNIFEDDLDEMLERREQAPLAGRSSGLRDGLCRDCRFWELCHGGCPMMGLLYHGDMMRETYFCAARKRLFEHFEKLFGPPAVSDQPSAPRLRSGQAFSGQRRKESVCHCSASSVARGTPFRAKQGEGDHGSVSLSPVFDPEAEPQAQIRREPRTLNPPSRFVVTIERPACWPMLDFVRIVTPHPDIERLTLGRLDPQERARGLVNLERFLASPSEYRAFARQLTIIFGAEALRLQSERPSQPLQSSTQPAKEALFDTLCRMRAELMFSPATIGDGTFARQAADAGVPVRLEFGTDYDEAVLSGLLDHFLHTPTLRVPIEPFFTLAGAIGGQRRLTLWQIFDNLAGQCLFVDAQQRVSVSRRHAQQGVFLGKVGDSIEAMRESAAWRQVEAYAERIFIEQTPCAFCEHYRYCGGIWRATSDADTACLTWRRVMDRMLEAYRGCSPIA
jgi:radical SAM protein with 4Fe4S-binding SPASM domain